MHSISVWAALIYKKIGSKSFYKQHIQLEFLYTKYVVVIETYSLYVTHFRCSYIQK
jgi:hypothetical protein